MKGKDFFKKTNDQAKLNNEDFNKTLETLPDFEIPDVWVNLFNEGFLTRERAEADPKITQKIKAETLNAVDAKITKLLPFIDSKDREEIEREPSSYKKIELLEKAIPSLVTKAKGENPNTAEEIKARDKQIQELADSVKNLKSEHEEEKKKLTATHTAEKVNMKVDWDLLEKINGLTLADEFVDTPDRKKATIELIKSMVKNGNEFNYDEQGQLRVYESKNGVTSLKFNGNDQVTPDSLVLFAANPFIKRNNANNDKGKEKDKTKRRESTHDDLDPNKMTLADRRRAAFAQ